MTQIYEIAPDVFRLSTFVPEIQLQFNQFLVRDEQPLLYHTGSARMFPAVYEAVSRLIDPAKLRWIGFSHYEQDECGSLNQWLEAAPQATAVATMVGVLVNLNEYLVREARPLMENEVLETGARRYRLIPTPQVPHGWDAGMLFEETGRVLFTSDLFHHNGDVEPLTSASLIERTRQTLVDYQNSPFFDYQPYTPNTQATLEKLAALNPATLATMHGSSFSGDARTELLRLGDLRKELAAQFYPASINRIAA